MPKGQKLIDWTPANDAKLMLTILAVEDVHPNCEAVAAAFGGSVNAMSISNRLSRLRKKAIDDGLVPKGGIAAPRKGNHGNKGNKGGKNASSSEDFPPTSSHPNLTYPFKNQKVLTGRVTKPCNAAKKDTKGSGKASDNVKATVEDDELGSGEDLEGKEEKMHDGEDGLLTLVKNEEEEDD